jgi:hypothetical protein
MGNDTGGGVFIFPTSSLERSGSPLESRFNFIMHQSSIILGNGIEVRAWNTNCSTWNIMDFCIAMIRLALGVACYFGAIC